MEHLTICLLFILNTICFPFLTRPYLHILQLCGYEEKGVLKSRKFCLYYIPICGIATMFIALWIIYFFVAPRVFWEIVLVLFFVLSNIILIVYNFRVKQKKPLKYTKRVKRLIAFSTLLYGGILCVFLSLIVYFNAKTYFALIVAFCLETLVPFIFLLASMALKPFENLNKLRYCHKAQKVFGENDNLIKIAIAGSCGKTSVKNYLAQMLSNKYSVLVTKDSYNTPMGMALTADDYNGQEVLIAEFGARHNGDIDELMNLIKPQYAILTEITGQHLETFKSLENIILEKKKVLNVDKIKVSLESLKHNFEEIDGVLTVGFTSGYSICDISEMTTNGSRFTMNLGDKTLCLKTSLLGKHNVLNLALAATMAYKLNIPLGDIENAIENMAPTPHRLNLLRCGGIDIIDDTFNSSIIGSKAALEALNMASGRKVILTPGLVELGHYEESANRELGMNITKVADVIMLVSPRLGLLEGINDSSFNKENLYIYESLSKAQDDFKNILKQGDTLLMLNDLPDNY